MAYLLRPRLAIVQIFLSTVLTWVLFYQFCQTFRADGLLHSECYLPGPDGLSGYRLSMMMFSFGALPSFVRAASGIGRSTTKWRPLTAIFAGIIVSVVVSWFPITAWFSGASYIQLFLPVQAAVLFGLPEIVCEILAARIGRSVWIAAVSGALSSLYLSASLWTLPCPGCDRSLLTLTVPSWGLFALLGGTLEVGVEQAVRLRLRAPLIPNSPTLRRLALAASITVSLWTLVAFPFWEPSVLYASSVSPDPGPLYLGLPIYRPYVAGYYNSTQYRICCLEIGVSLSKVDTSIIAPSIFLMAGMGVQSPNCCIDGWDFGWRADVFILPNGTLLVSGSSW